MLRHGQAAVLLGAFLFLFGCGSDDGPDASCTPGEQYCQCHMGACFGQLSCENDICVPATGDGDGDNTGDGDGDNTGDGDGDNTGDGDGDNTGDGDSCGAGEMLCAGSCTDVMTDDLNCGSCGNVCNIVNGFGHCSDGICAPALSECMLTADPPKSCIEVCAESGKSCAVGGCAPGFTWVWYGSLDLCEQFLGGDGNPSDCAGPLTAAGNVYRCCCQ